MPGKRRAGAGRAIDRPPIRVMRNDGSVSAGALLDPVAADELFAAHVPIGASSGYMATLRGDWSALVATAREVSPAAIELSALDESELDGLLTFLRSWDGLPFRYVSVHAPSKARSLSDADLAAVLGALPPYVTAIVMHPDTLGDPAALRHLGGRLVLENMDRRKDDGRTADELSPFFATLPDAGLCFDIAHAASMDTDLDTAGGLLDSFGPRLRHVHLSSLDRSGAHVSLTQADAARFAPLLRRCADVPWILEAPPPS